MKEKKYKVVLKRTVELVDFEKAGKPERFVNKPAGEYFATLKPHPYDKNGSSWLILDGTTIGATFEYLQTQATVMAV